MLKILFEKNFYRTIIAMILSVVAFFASLFPASNYFFPETPVKKYQEKDEERFEMKQYDLIVSPNGNDAWSGRLLTPDSNGTDGPLKTLSGAKERLKAYKGQVTETVTVWFRAGTYYFDETAAFTSDDLGSVAYKAYPGEEVKFNGSVPVSGWTKEKVNGTDVWATDFSGGQINAMYSRETRLPRTRYPETGYLFVHHTDPADIANDTTEIYYDRANAFYANENELPAFYNIQDISVRILHYWKDELATMTSLDSASGRVGLSRRTTMTCNKGDKYFLENVFEALNEPGEWYQDTLKGKLYYVPKAGEDIGSTVLYAGHLQRLITIDGTDNLTFKGITFEKTDWQIPRNNQETDLSSQAAYDAVAVVHAANADHITIENCNFYCIGEGCVKFGFNVKDSTVTGCEFINIGAQAVFIQGENVQLDDPNITRNISVTNNHITQYGRTFANAVAVLLIHANNCNLSNNEVHDGYYSAFSVGWVWGYGYNVTNNNRVCDNLIYDIGQGWLSDMGGIYTLGIQDQTVVSGNVIYNVAADSLQGGYGGWGIYLDEGSTGILVEKNLVYKCGSQSFHQHYGRDNCIRNNIFALSAEGQIASSRKEEHNEFTLTGNIIVSDNQPIYKNIEKDKFKDDGNFYWDYTRGKFVKSGSTEMIKSKFRSYVKGKGYYKNGIFENPQFKDIEHFDFTLAVNSPAVEAGFETWDYTRAGTLTKFH